MNPPQHLASDGAPPRLVRPTRSRFVTVFAWCLMALSALGCVVSAAALLMVLAGSHGSPHSSLVEGFVVLGVPPLTLIASVGLLRRWRWAYGYMLVLLACIGGWNIAIMLRGPTPQRTYLSPTGVPTTVLASEVDYPKHLAAAAVSLGLLATLLTRRVRDDFKSKRPASAPSAARDSGLRARPVQASKADGARDWRVGHQGRDEMYYEERINGGWQRLRISGEMLMGRAHHAIYFASPVAWLEFPEWARHRREEIIARIKSEFRSPDYEYHGGETERASQPS